MKRLHNRWLKSALLAGLAMTSGAAAWAAEGAAAAADAAEAAPPAMGSASMFYEMIFGVGIAVGVVESCMARLRLVRVPQILVGATVLVALSFPLLAR